MRQHRTLGATGRAGGIKQPCQMAPINRSGLDRFARSHFLVACGPRQHDVFQANDVARYFRYAVSKVIADETDLGASIFEDIGEFPGCRRAFIGTTASPACHAPNIISEYSGAFFIAMATRSPGSMPGSANNAWARRADRPACCS